MIYEVKDYYLLHRISRLIDKGIFKDLNYTADQFFNYLIERFDKDKIKVFASVKNKRIEGFGVCSLNKDLITGKPEVFIDLGWVDKKAERKVAKELLKKIEDYAKSLNISRITGYTKKDLRGIYKKYGFLKDYIVVYKELKKEDSHEQVKESRDGTSSPNKLPVRSGKVAN